MSQEPLFGFEQKEGCGSGKGAGFIGDNKMGFWDLNLNKKRGSDNDYGIHVSDGYKRRGGKIPNA